MTETRSVMQEISPKLASLTADVLFGDVWERPELSKRDRGHITVAMLIATLTARGADHVGYKGLQGAVVQRGMTVMAHNGAVMVRIRQQCLPKRGQKFRRLLGLRRHHLNRINDPSFKS